ncbi:MAG: LytTR family DNA-binding domain-containing protein [Candidatus Phaeomarinobacter sp.]
MLIDTFSRVFQWPNSNSDQRGFAFFVITPLALAAVTATTTGYSETFGLVGAFFYVSLLSVIPWWVGEGTTRVAWFAMKPLTPPLWFVCTVGILVACVFIGPYVSYVSSVFYGSWSSHALSQGLPPQNQSTPVDVFMQVARAMFFWIGANYVFDRLLNYPRFRYESAHQLQAPIVECPDQDAEQGELLRRSTKFGNLSDILTVKAEEHYVRVTGAHSQELVAFSFGLALKDLQGQDGFQVHRSYWVRRSAVVRVKTGGSKMSLEISDGSVVPVSGPYHALIRQVF